MYKTVDAVHLPCLGTQDLKFTNLNHAKLEKAFYKKNQHTSLGNSVRTNNNKPMYSTLSCVAVHFPLMCTTLIPMRYHVFHQKLLEKRIKRNHEVRLTV